MNHDQQKKQEIFRNNIKLGVSFDFSNSIGNYT